MKRFLSKLPAIIAMGFGLVSLFFSAQSLSDPTGEIWSGAVFFALFSLPFFLLDAVIAFVSAMKKQDAKFNYLLALVLVGLIPMLFLFADNVNVIFNVIWVIYYLMVFVLELISIKKAWIAMKSAKKTA